MAAVGRCEGCDIVTLEGFQKTERFKVISDAYAAVSAVQCGYCIPGMVLATEAILSKIPHPTEEQIREGLSGNLCRCTGYNAIVKAVQIASEEEMDYGKRIYAHITSGSVGNTVRQQSGSIRRRYGSDDQRR